MILIVAPRLRGALRERVLSWKPAAIVVVTNAPDSVWTRSTSSSNRAQLRDPTRQAGGPLLLRVRPASLHPVGIALGADFGTSQPLGSCPWKRFVSQLTAH